MPAGTVTWPEIDPVAAAARAAGGAGLSLGGDDGVGDAEGVAAPLAAGLTEGEGVGEGLLWVVSGGLALGDAEGVGSAVAVDATVGLGVGAAVAGPPISTPDRSVATTAVTASQERTRVRGCCDMLFPPKRNTRGSPGASLAHGREFPCDLSIARRPGRARVKRGRRHAHPARPAPHVRPRRRSPAPGTSRRSAAPSRDCGSRTRAPRPAPRRSPARSGSARAS